MRQTALRQILINCLKAIFAACLPIYLYYTLVIHVQIKTPSLSVLPTVENDTEAVIAHPLSFQTPDSPETCVTGSGFALLLTYIHLPQLHVLQEMLSLGLVMFLSFIFGAEE